MQFISKTISFHYVCAVILYSIKYLVSAVNSGRWILTGWFTELTDSVLDTRTRAELSHRSRATKKGHTDRIRTVLIRDHLQVLRRNWNHTRTFPHILYNFTLIILSYIISFIILPVWLCVRLLHEIIRMRAQSACNRSFGCFH